jgi:hypothetical protein
VLRRERVVSVTVPTVTAKSASGEFFVLFSPGPKIEEVKFISGSEELKNAGERLRSVKFPVEFPSPNPAHIARRGILVCNNGACSFTFYLPNDVHSVN